MKRIAIIGGGLAGISIAYFLRARGVEFKIFEKNAEIGGLCKTSTLDGIEYDVSGVHVIHSKNEATLKLMLDILDNRYFKRTRIAKILYRKKLYNFPFGSDIETFPLLDKIGFIFSYRWQKALNWAKEKRPNNYSDWCSFEFGGKLATRHYLPYGEKIYKSNLEEVGFKWIEKIIPKPDVYQWYKIFRRKPKPQKPSFLYYPKEGGIFSLIRNFAKGMEKCISKGYEIQNITRTEDGHSIDGETFHGVISTIPLSELGNIFQGFDIELQKKIKQLKHLSLYTMFISTTQIFDRETCWTYIPEIDTSPFNRVTFLGSLKTDSDDRQTGVLCEMTVHPEFKHSALKEIEQNGIKSLEELGLIRSEFVIASTINFTEHAYILGDLFYEEHIESIRSEIGDHGIILHGRFGRHEYQNMDNIILNSQIIASTL